MITDYALRLSENQTAAGTAGAVTDHIIDLLQARNIALGEALYAVVTITEAFDSAASNDPFIVWSFYASDVDTKADSSVAHTLGSSSIYSGAASWAALPQTARNLIKGQKITVPLVPITNYAVDTSALSDPITGKGRRYVYGGFAVTGTGQFTTGKFTIDICTQSMLGGSSSTSDIPIYPKSYTVQ